MSENTHAINPRTTGFFGKIPGHGDFIDRGLPASFKETWDNWLQHGLSSSKTVIGESWLNVYLTSPVWRFALCSGVCGPQAWAGILIPSVDRVGRYFPLTIATSLPTDSVPIQLVVTGADWFDGIESLARQALEHDTTDANALAMALEELGDLDITNANLRTTDNTVAGQMGGALALPFTYGSSPGQGLLAYTHQMTRARFGASYSAWWTQGSDLVHPVLMVCSQLPVPESFAGLLADEYASAGWETLPGYTVGDQPPETEDADEAHADTAPISVDEELQQPPPIPASVPASVPAPVPASVNEEPQEPVPVYEDSTQTTDFTPEQVSSDSILADLGRSEPAEDAE